MKDLLIKLKLFILNLKIKLISSKLTFVVIIFMCWLSILGSYWFSNVNKNNDTKHKIKSIIVEIYNKPIITPVTPVTTIIPRSKNLISRGEHRTITPTIKPTPRKYKIKNIGVNKSKVKNQKVKNKNVNFKYVDSGIYYVTMYTLAYNECGKYPWHKYYGFGSSGVKVRVKESVAMGKGIPYNTKIKIEGFDNIYINHDTGSKIYNNCVDIFTNNLKISNNFGRQKRKVWILSWGNGKVNN